MKKLVLFFFIFSLGIVAWGQDYNSGYPNFTSVGETTATAISEVNFPATIVAVTTKYIVQPTGNPKPSVDEIKNTGTTININLSDIEYSSPIAGLSASTQYTIYFVTQFINTAPFGFGSIESTSPTEVTFTTAAAATPPSITNYSPADEADPVILNQNLQLTFNENIQFVSGSSAFLSIRRTSDNELFAAYDITATSNLSILNNVLTITHPNFDESTSYYVTIQDGLIESVATGTDFGGILSTTQWNFTSEVFGPQWNSNFPTVDTPSKTAITVNGEVNKGGNYYMVVTQSNTAPSAAQIKLGNNENNIAALLTTTAASTADVTFSPSLDISGLNSQTQYWVYIVTESTVDKFSSVEQLTFTTLDTQAPSYQPNFPAVEVLDELNTNLSVFTAEDGNVFWVILPSGATAPSPSQVKAGTDSNDAPVFIMSGNVALSSTEAITVPIFGTTANTSYVAYFVSQDSNQNDIETTTATPVPFTTLAPAPEILTYSPTNNATNVTLSQSLQLTFNENIQIVTGSEASFKIMNSDETEFATFGILNGNVSITGATLTITHPDFAEGASYYVIIGDGFVESVATGADSYGITEVTEWNFTTETLEPQWITGYPNLQNLTKTGLDAIGQVDENGNYYLVVTTSSTAPSNAQVKAGQDHTGAASPITSAGAVTADTDFTANLDISSLSSETDYWVYMVVEDGLSQFSSVEQLPFTTLQTSWTATYPNIQNQTKTNMDIYGQVNGSGNYYLVVTESNTEPTIEQIKLGTDDLGAAALLTANATATANTEFISNLDLSGLTSETDYWVYAVVEDAFGKNTSIASIAFTQFDTQAPVYVASKPEITNITGITATLEVQTNENGRTYWVVLPAADMAPSILQVLNGTDASDNALGSAGNRGLIANELLQVITNNYTSETDYKAYVVTRDNSDNVIETVNPTMVSFTTSDITSPIATFDPANTSVDIALDKIITITFTEAVYNIADELITNANVGTIVTLNENSSGGTIVNAVITYDEVNFIITINTTSDLKELQLYNISLSTLQDASSNLVASTNTTFTTEDTTAPVTTFVDPDDGDVNRSIGSSLEISFDEAIRAIGGAPITDIDLQTIINFSPLTTFTASLNSNEDGIIIFPSSPYLTPSTTYTITVNPVEDLSGNTQSVASSIDFTTASFNTWTGAAGDNDFFTAGNYSGEYSAGASVIVKAGTPLVNINANTDIPNLILEPLARVTIETGATVSLSEELTLKSDATGTGSLIIQGNLSVSSSKINIEQHISDPTQYEFVSSPVQGATPTNVGADGSIYRWNNITGNWVSHGTDANFSTLSGYILKSSSNLLYKGALNNGPHTINAEGTPKNSGFTLAGNPYTAAFDWDELTAGDTTNIEDKFWMFSNGIYGSYNGADNSYVNLEENASLIPSGHAFWIKAVWESGQTVTGFLSLNESMLAHNHTSYLKSSSSTYDTPHIRLSGNNNDVKCEMLITFNPDASESYERYDTERFFGFNKNAIELFSEVDSKKLAINSYSELTDNMFIPLGYKTQKSGTFSINLKDLVNIDNSLQVILTDHEESVSKDLNNDGAYEFSSDSVTSTNRFSLELIGSISTDLIKNLKKEPVDIYSVQKTIFINIDNLNNPHYKIYDIDGKLIKAGNLDKQSLNQVQLNRNKGIYIVKVIGDEYITSKKVIIN